MLKKNVFRLVLLSLSTLFLFYSCETTTKNVELEELKKENKELKVLAKSSLDAFKTPWERFLDGPDWDDFLPPELPPPTPPPPLTRCEQQCVVVSEGHRTSCRSAIGIVEPEAFHECMAIAAYGFKLCFAKCLENQHPGNKDIFSPDQPVKNTDG